MQAANRFCCASLRLNSRRFCTLNRQVLEKLQNRSLVRVFGEDAANLLQGVITNDMQHLSRGARSLYAMFLNNKGRVLYDTIIYRAPTKNLFYVEVDAQIADLIRKHIKIYCLRKKVDVNIADDYSVWANFNPRITTDNDQVTTNLTENVVPCTGSGDENSSYMIAKQDGEVLIFRDPRLAQLGSRILTRGECNLREVLTDFRELETVDPQQHAAESTYKSHRYKLGVGEGIEELPPGNCFPLEANCDYLHGVSFHKGCYIGQELTARTHHTGVIRKRLMPLFLSETFREQPAKDEIVKVGDANVGKLRGFEGNVGLGLLRVEKVLENTLIVNKTQASTLKPDWWPKEAIKEKVSLKK